MNVKSASQKVSQREHRPFLLVQIWGYEMFMPAATGIKLAADDVSSCRALRHGAQSL